MNRILFRSPDRLPNGSWKQLAKSPIFLSCLVSAIFTAQTTSALQAQTVASGIDPNVLIKANAGDAASQCDVGLAYDRGNRVQQDEVKAAAWLRKAADQNYARDQYDPGVSYFSGHGAPRD